MARRTSPALDLRPASRHHTKPRSARPDRTYTLERQQVYRFQAPVYPLCFEIGFRSPERCALARGQRGADSWRGANQQRAAATRGRAYRLDRRGRPSAGVGAQRARMHLPGTEEITLPANRVRPGTRARGPKHHAGVDAPLHGRCFATSRISGSEMLEGGIF